VAASEEAAVPAVAAIAEEVPLVAANAEAAVVPMSSAATLLSVAAEATKADEVAPLPAEVPVVEAPRPAAVHPAADLAEAVAEAPRMADRRGPTDVVEEEATLRLPVAVAAPSTLPPAGVTEIAVSASKATDVVARRVTAPTAIEIETAARL